MESAELVQLASLLRKFFKEYSASFNGRDFAWRNPVAKCLKAELVKLDRWKNLPRGKPAKEVGRPRKR
jgi:hypothetical protein